MVTSRGRSRFKISFQCLLPKKKDFSPQLLRIVNIYQLFISSFSRFTVLTESCFTSFTGSARNQTDVMRCLSLSSVLRLAKSECTERNERGLVHKRQSSSKLFLLLLDLFSLLTGSLLWKKNAGFNTTTRLTTRWWIIFRVISRLVLWSQ